MTKPANPPLTPKPVPPPRTYVHAVARWCIRPLLNTPVTPNHLTVLRLLTGLAAAGAFAAGDYFWACWGGVLFAISAVLDRADGELARLGGRISTGGHWFDLGCDMAVNVLTFVGIGIGLSERLPGAWGPALGVIAGGSVAAIFIVTFRLHSVGAHPSVAFHYPSGFDFDDALFVISLVAWLDGLFWFLVAAAVGTPLFLVFALWQFSKVERKSEPNIAPPEQNPARPEADPEVQL